MKPTTRLLVVMFMVASVMAEEPVPAPVPAPVVLKSEQLVQAGKQYLNPGPNATTAQKEELCAKVRAELTGQQVSLEAKVKDAVRNTSFGEQFLLTLAGTSQAAQIFIQASINDEKVLSLKVGTKVSIKGLIHNVAFRLENEKLCIDLLIKKSEMVVLAPPDETAPVETPKETVAQPKLLPPPGSRAGPNAAAFEKLENLKPAMVVVKPGTGQDGLYSVDFKNMALVNVCAILSKTTGMKIVSYVKTKSKVTLKLNAKSIGDICLSVATASGTKVEPVGKDGYRFSSKENSP